MSLSVRPITFKAACEYVRDNHRHHKPPVGHKFSIAAYKGDRLCGVVMAGRPVARGADDGLTLEVNRLCTDGTRNACSLLYAAAWKAGKAMGYKRIITYTLESESGTSLKAAGWKKDADVPGRAWNCPSRPRKTKAPTCNKQRWIKEAHP